MFTSVALVFQRLPPVTTFVHSKVSRFLYVPAAPYTSSCSSAFGCWTTRLVYRRVRHFCAPSVIKIRFCVFAVLSFLRPFSKHSPCQGSLCACTAYSALPARSLSSLLFTGYSGTFSLYGPADYLSFPGRRSSQASPHPTGGVLVPLQVRRRRDLPPPPPWPLPPLFGGLHVRVKRCCWDAAPRFRWV
jgi:hypothetical protein